MNQSQYWIRISNRTFERYSGVGYLDTGGSPERCYPLRNADLGLYLKVADCIRDEAGQIIGCTIQSQDTGTIHSIFPGEVYRLDTWVTCLDDDGDPDEICISYFVELIPADALPPKN